MLKVHLSLNILNTFNLRTNYLRSAQRKEWLMKATIHILVI